MAYELIYTSAPAGIRQGSTGFCVVACTKGIGPRLVMTLEALSAYKPLYPHYAENAWDNPISRAHFISTVNGAVQHILSRVSPTEPEGFHEPKLHCHYHIQLIDQKAEFTLYRTREDLDTLLEEAEALGISAAVGLWQELG